MKGTVYRNLMQNVFAGKYSQQLRCQAECGQVRSSPEPFYCLSVEVKNQKTLDASLRHLVKGDLISDYKCETCGKLGVLKRSTVDALSNTLFIHLQRFEFEFINFTRVKLNTLFEFPMHLDMYP